MTIQKLGKIFATYITGKGLVSRIYEGHQEIKNKKKHPKRKIDKKHINRHSPEGNTNGQWMSEMMFNIWFALQWDTHFILTRSAEILKFNNNKCWKECGETTTRHSFSGSINWYGYRKTIWHFLVRGKTGTPYDPAIPPPGMYPRHSISLSLSPSPFLSLISISISTPEDVYKNVSCHMSIQMSITTKLTCKCWYVDAMQYYPSVKINNHSTHEYGWISQTILSEKSKTKKNTLCCFIYLMIQIQKN